MLDASLLNQLTVSSLTRDDMAVPDASEVHGDLPSTFVPGRNIVFLTLACIYAYQVQARTVITGVCETDFSGYPDCRDEFVKSLNQAIALGMAYEVNIETPLMWLNKAEVWALADTHHQLELVRDQTLTCYNGLKGAGCGRCSACDLRAKGLADYLNNTAHVRHSLRAKLQKTA